MKSGNTWKRTKEIEERRQNIIVYKVPEDVSAEFATRKDNDMKFITGCLMCFTLIFRKGILRRFSD